MRSLIRPGEALLLSQGGSQKSTNQRNGQEESPPPVCRARLMAKHFDGSTCRAVHELKLNQEIVCSAGVCLSRYHMKRGSDVLARRRDGFGLPPSSRSLARLQRNNEMQSGHSLALGDTAAQVELADSQSHRRTLAFRIRCSGTRLLRGSLCGTERPQARLLDAAVRCQLARAVRCDAVLVILRGRKRRRSEERRPLPSAALASREGALKLLACARLDLRCVCLL